MGLNHSRVCSRLAAIVAAATTGCSAGATDVEDGAVDAAATGDVDAEHAAASPTPADATADGAERAADVNRGAARKGAPTRGAARYYIGFPISHLGDCCSGPGSWGGSGPGFWGGWGGFRPRPGLDGWGAYGAFGPGWGGYWPVNPGWGGWGWGWGGCGGGWGDC